MILPTDSRDLSDPGDVVQGKFRYQHAYGVILSVGMATGRLDYTAIWCEQQEDFLAETESASLTRIKSKQESLNLVSGS